jgi:hypothetical protein
MNPEQLSDNLLSLDHNIRFVGVMEASTGYMFAGKMREGVEGYLKGTKPDLSFAQSAYTVHIREKFFHELGELEYVIYKYGKVKLISLPINIRQGKRERKNILLFSTHPNADVDDIVNKVSDYIRSIESQLIILEQQQIKKDKEVMYNQKKQTLRYLYESGIDEEMIAEQIDLELDTVRALIEELHQETARK